MPAEWEPQSMVQLTWPHEATDWAPILADITAVYEEMAREISKREGLLIVAPEGTHLPSPLTHHLTPITSNDTWARDHGFITVEELSPITHQPSPILLDFCFNGWGEKFEATLDNQINRHLYEQGLVKGTYEDHLDFVLEGGSIESDGKGTIFTTSCCLMAPHRNQPLSRQEIEERLKTYLGAERIVWLEHGSLMGDDTDGHIDTLVRICPDDTLLYTGGDEDHPCLCPAPSTTKVSVCQPPMPTTWLSTGLCWCPLITSPTSTQRLCALSVRLFLTGKLLVLTAGP